MNVFPFFGFSRARIFGARLLTIATMVMVALASFVVGPMPAMAQMEFDFNGDGTVTCADFREEFPDTFTDEATKALRQFPDDLSALNRDSQDDTLACEGQPASAPPAAPAPAPASPPDTSAPPSSTGAPAASSLETADVPADVMARVEGCAVIAISPHDLTGAGCPGVGVVTYRVPAGAPLMKGTVILNPGAAQAAEAGPARESAAATGANGPTRGQETTKAGKDDAKASKGKNTKQERDSKNKNTKKGGKNKNKQDKNKKDKKQRRR